MAPLAPEQLTRCSTWNKLGTHSLVFHVEQMHHFPALHFHSPLVYIQQEVASRSILKSSWE